MSPFPDAWVAELHHVLSDHVERGDLPGLIALVAHGGSTHVEVIGTRAFGDPDPLPRDAIFRIASLSKPISAVAAMTLVDDGTLALDDPVDDLLPELAARRVLRRIDADLDDTVPATRPITVEDLLTFRLGFGNVMAPPGTYPIQLAEEQLQLATLGPPWPPPPFGPDEWIARLGTLPLMHQPGEAWLYNTGSQVLGVLLQRATGLPLEALLRERLFEPLDMPDTAFSFTPAQRDRMTTAYVPRPRHRGTGPARRHRRELVGPASHQPRRGRRPAVSTIDDLWAFVQLFLDGGVHRGRRIISEASLALMTTDHLTPAQRAAGAAILGPHDSWGLGLAVPASGGDRAHIPGGFGWIGGSGTSWRTDPDRDLTGILLTQRGLASPEPPPLFDDFWRAAYAVLAV